MSSKKSYVNTLKGRITDLYCSSKTTAKKFNYDHNITTRDLIELWYKQDGLCALTGLPLSLVSQKGIRNYDLISLDRINSSLGYVIGNVQFVLFRVNVMKSNLDQKVFVDLCGLIHSYFYNGPSCR